MATASLEVTIPSRPNGRYLMQMVDAAEYDSWLDTMTKAGWMVAAQHHVPTYYFVVLTRSV